MKIGIYETRSRTKTDGHFDIHIDMTDAEILRGGSCIGDEERATIYLSKIKAEGIKIELKEPDSQEGREHHLAASTRKAVSYSDGTRVFRFCFRNIFLGNTKADRACGMTKVVGQPVPPRSLAIPFPDGAPPPIKRNGKRKAAVIEQMAPHTVEGRLADGIRTVNAALAELHEREGGEIQIMPRLHANESGPPKVVLSVRRYESSTFS